MVALPAWLRLPPLAKVTSAYVVVLAVGTALLLLSAAEEPYHIDELRQVSTYSESPATIVAANFRQTQPPLDGLVGAAFQRLAGVGDLRQRLPSVMFAVVAVMALLWLCAHGPLPTTSWVAGALVVTSPLFIQMSAYARPYALPLALMLLFLVIADRWLKSGTAKQFVGMVVVALFLPLARTTEPTIFLVAVAGVMSLQAWRGAGEARRRHGVVAALAAGAVMVVGLPVFAAVRAHATPFIATEETSRLQQLSRLASDLPAALADTFSPWPLVLALVIASLAFSHSRRLLFGTWWWWVLVAVPLMFALAFFLTTPVDQPLFSRYMFFAIPPVAVCLAALVTNVGGWGSAPRPKRMLLLAGVVGVLLVQGASAMRLVTSPANADHARASEALVTQTGEGTVVLFERAVPLGQYRGAFWGNRYLANRRRVYALTRFLRSPTTASKAEEAAVLLLSPRPPDVEGWRATRVDNFFTLYVPQAQDHTAGAVRSALETFVTALDDTQDAGFRMALAAVLDQQGQREQARRLVAPLLESAETAVAREQLTAAGLSHLLP